MKSRAIAVPKSIKHIPYEPSTSRQPMGVAIVTAQDLSFTLHLTHPFLFSAEDLLLSRLSTKIPVSMNCWWCWYILLRQINTYYIGLVGGPLQGLHQGSLHVYLQFCTSLITYRQRLTAKQPRPIHEQQKLLMTQTHFLGTGTGKIVNRLKLPIKDKEH